MQSRPALKKQGQFFLRFSYDYMNIFLYFVAVLIYPFKRVLKSIVSKDKMSRHTSFTGCLKINLVMACAKAEIYRTRMLKL